MKNARKIILHQLKKINITYATKKIQTNVSYVKKNTMHEIIFVLYEKKMIKIAFVKKNISIKYDCCRFQIDLLSENRSNYVNKIKNVKNFLKQTRDDWSNHSIKIQNSIKLYMLDFNYFDHYIFFFLKMLYCNECFVIIQSSINEVNDWLKWISNEIIRFWIYREWIFKWNARSNFFFSTIFKIITMIIAWWIKNERCDDVHAIQKWNDVFDVIV